MRDGRSGGHEEVAGRMLEGASRLRYAGRDAEAETARRLAGWVAELSPELVERVAAAVELLRQMREVNAACARMQRGYQRLEARVADRHGLATGPRSV